MSSLLELNVLEFGLLLAGWMVAYLLGKELSAGLTEWRARRARFGDRDGR